MTVLGYAKWHATFHAHSVNKLKVILLSIVAACTYGVLHDQITIRVCEEYFTVAHPPLFHTTSPTLLALCWGIAATLGIGFLLGGVLALVSQSGEQPPYKIPRLVRSITILLLVMSLSALAAGILGYQLSERGVIFIPSVFDENIPRENHHRFMAAWFAHGASYLVGLAGGSFLCLRIWRERGRPPVLSIFPRTRVAAIRAILITIAAAFALWMRFRPQ